MQGTSIRWRPPHCRHAGRVPPRGLSLGEPPFQFCNGLPAFVDSRSPRRAPHRRRVRRIQQHGYSRSERHRRLDMLPLTQSNLRDHPRYSHCSIQRRYRHSLGPLLPPPQYQQVRPHLTPDLAHAPSPRLSSPWLSRSHSVGSEELARNLQLGVAPVRLDAVSPIPSAAPTHDGLRIPAHSPRFRIALDRAACPVGTLAARSGVQPSPSWVPLQR